MGVSWIGLVIVWREACKVSVCWNVAVCVVANETTDVSHVFCEDVELSLSVNIKTKCIVIVEDAILVDVGEEESAIPLVVIDGTSAPAFDWWWKVPSNPWDNFVAVFLGHIPSIRVRSAPIPLVGGVVSDEAHACGGC